MKHIHKASFISNFLGGWGTLVLFPSTDYSKLIDKRTAEQRMRSHWVGVGRHISYAADRYGEGEGWRYEQK